VSGPAQVESASTRASQAPAQPQGSWPANRSADTRRHRGVLLTRATRGTRLGDRDIGRFATPKKLAGYTGLCPFVRQSGNRAVRGPLDKNGPKYLRWALIEAAIGASRHQRYREPYERTKRRLGRQRGAKVARIELARDLSGAIWHMLTKDEAFAPAGPAIHLVA